MSLLDHNGIASTSDRLFAAAKRNPEGVLLLAAGAALLMRRSGAIGAMRGSRSNGHYRSERDSGTRRSAGEGMSEGMSQRAHGMADSARSYASGAADQIARSAEGIADYTTSMARAAADRSGRLAHDAGSTVRGAMDRMLEEQPVTLALFGLAAGAVLASILPSSEMERSALGPIGKKMNETAEEAGERLKKSASKVGERLGEIAEERGLSAKGLRETARDVAQTFSEEMTAGEEQQHQQASSGQQQGSPSSQQSSAGQRQSSGMAQSSGNQQQQQAYGGSESRALDPMDPARRLPSTLGSGTSQEDRTAATKSRNPSTGGRMS